MMNNIQKRDEKKNLSRTEKRVSGKKYQLLQGTQSTGRAASLWDIQNIALF